MRLCKVCGETDPDKFYRSAKTICYECHKVRAKERYRNMSESEKTSYKKKVNEWNNNNVFVVRCLHAKHRSNRKNKKFDLSAEYLEELYEQQEGKCYYSGRYMTTDDIGNMDTVSIDRIDSSLGYTKDNIVLCCWAVNEMKKALSYENFINIIKDIYNCHVRC